MIELTLGNRPGFKHISKFSEFLKTNGTTKAVNKGTLSTVVWAYKKDQWNLFFDFSRSAPDNFTNWNSDEPCAHFIKVQFNIYRALFI